MVLLFGKNLTVLITQKRSKKAFDKFYIEVRYLQSFAIKVELNFYSDIITHLNIAMHLDISKHLKIAIYISKSVKLKNRDRVLAFSAFSI